MYYLVNASQTFCSLPPLKVTTEARTKTTKSWQKRFVVYRRWKLRPERNFWSVITNEASNVIPPHPLCPPSKFKYLILACPIEHHVCKAVWHTWKNVMAGAARQRGMTTSTAACEINRLKVKDEWQSDGLCVQRLPCEMHTTRWQLFWYLKCSLHLICQPGIQVHTDLNR